jgi:hypothetical protein
MIHRVRFLEEGMEVLVFFVVLQYLLFSLVYFELAESSEAGTCFESFRDSNVVR